MPSDSHPLSRILASAARRMKIDFEETSEIVHRGEKGGVREYDLLAFMKKYLPRNVEVLGSAEIISIDGQRSTQSDIVICDPSTPPLFDRGGYRIIPNECVYAVIEVKSMLDGPAMQETREKLAAIKRMPKTSYFPQPFSVQPQVYGQSYDYFPTQGYVFAYNSIELSNFISDAAVRSYRVQPYAERIDGAWILGKGMLNWLNPRTRAPHPNSEPGLWLSAGKPPEGQDVLLNMILMIATRMAQVSMSPFNLIPYANDVVMMDDVQARGPLDFQQP